MMMFSSYFIWVFLYFYSLILIPEVVFSPSALVICLSNLIFSDFVVLELLRSDRWKIPSIIGILSSILHLLGFIVPRYFPSSDLKHMLVRLFLFSVFASPNKIFNLKIYINPSERAYIF